MQTQIDFFDKLDELNNFKVPSSIAGNDSQPPRSKTRGIQKKAAQCDSSGEFEGQMQAMKNCMEMMTETNRQSIKFLNSIIEKFCTKN